MYIFASILMIAVVILVFLLVRKGRALNVCESQAKSYLLDLKESEESYVALEQGMSEQEENYEQQFLSLTERIQAKDDLIVRMRQDTQELLDVVKFHEANCLPHIVNSG